MLEALPPAEEVTVEANPETVTPELAAALRSAGVTRVSLGAQTFQPELLRVLERAAGPDDVRSAVRHLRDGRIRQHFARSHLRDSRPERRRSRRRPRRRARARAGAPLLLRARGEAGDALHPCLGNRAGTAGRGARGLLRACRRPPDRRRLPLVRDGQLLPHRRESGGTSARGTTSRYWLGRDYLGLGIGAVTTIEERRWRNTPKLAALPRRARLRPGESSRSTTRRRRASA